MAKRVKRLTAEEDAPVVDVITAEDAARVDAEVLVERSLERAAPAAERIVDEATLREVVERDLRAGGILSRSLPGYEQRPAQIAMTRIVAEALTSGEHALIEAGTGTGKGFAYLLPIVRSGKVALVSTANKALQEQLFYKDIPFVQRHVQMFKAALVKGMGNYLCLDRLPEEAAFQNVAKHPAFAKMQARLDPDEDDWDGDFDLLTETLPGDVRGRLAADSDQCAWRSCNYYQDCYVRKMRERSRDAQVIVVNHTLLLLDAAMGGFLLPERDVIVIDEAHHLEEEATRAFTVTVTPGRVASLMSQHRLRDHASQGAQLDAQGANELLWSALQRVTRPDARGRQVLTQPLEEGLRLASTIDALANSLQVNRPANQDDKEEQLYERLVKRTRSLAADLRVVFGMKSAQERVYYVEQIGGTGRRQPQPSVSAAPLHVAEMLREQLFDKIPTIATSATLAVGGDFRFYRSRVGLNAAKEAVLPLAFDYPGHALLYVPRMQREPAFGAASGPYFDELAEQMRELVVASEGRAFLLFSSQNALRGVHERLKDVLETQDYSLIVQGRDTGRLEMLRQFREWPRAVLFGLKSFWEGVDVAGEALSLVAIDKLPFDPPDDPVQEARVAKMKERGENWFGDYVLPQAILRLKQGIGRLLRTSEDRGVMAILDTRLHTKGYGRQVIAALPPARRTMRIEDVERFFEAV
jgi:Rad3-related DNA helicase